MKRCLSSSTSSNENTFNMLNGLVDNDIDYNSESDEDYTIDGYSGESTDDYSGESTDDMNTSEVIASDLTLIITLIFRKVAKVIWIVIINVIHRMATNG